MEKEIYQSNHFDRIRLFFNDLSCPLADSEQKIKEWRDDLMIAINNAETEYQSLINDLKAIERILENSKTKINL